MKNSPRLDALRAYVAHAIAEGLLDGLQSPLDFIARVTKLFGADLSTIATEMLEMQAEAAGKQFSAAAYRKLGDAVSGALQDPIGAWRKVKGIWGSLSRNYARGADAMRRK